MAREAFAIAAANWLLDGLTEECAVDVDYIVHPHALQALKAIPGDTQFATVDIESAVASSRQFDWTVAADKLWVNGVKVEPAKGHEIRYLQRDGRTAVFEVLPLVNDRPYSVPDPLGVMYTIHTKLKEIEAAP